MKVYVLSREKHSLVEAGIKAARESNRSLRTSLELLTERLIKEAAGVEVSALQEGHQYNVLDVSPTANAWRNGVLKLNHGELYEYCYQYGGDGMLHQENGWGSPVFKKIRAEMLLIEE